MNQVSILVILYILGLLCAAVFLDLWGSETGPKALLGLGWTAIFLIALFYAERKK
tara:strand:- start:130 stop:294 length:165 start_codon:yes stop_codon:yes gene_type:complete